MISRSNHQFINSVDIRASRTWKTFLSGNGHWQTGFFKELSICIWRRRSLSNLLSYSLSASWHDKQKSLWYGLSRGPIPPVIHCRFFSSWTRSWIMCSCNNISIDVSWWSSMIPNLLLHFFLVCLCVRVFRAFGPNAVHPKNVKPACFTCLCVNYM